MYKTKLKTGDLIDERYELMESIADGGVARIFKVFDNKTNEIRALKVLFEHYKNNETVRKRFLSEAHLQKALVHPNIVAVYEIYEDPDLCFVMEYVNGPTLEQYLRQRNMLTYEEIYNIMVPAMRAISFAHTMGVVHRDIKPSNILLHKEGSHDGFSTKIIDLGVAKNSRAKQHITAYGTTVGTLQYMSPEQVCGSGDLDERADVYSVGVTLHKLVTGRVPFNATNEYDLMLAQVQQKPTPPSKLRKDIPEEFEELILKAMNKDREERFVSMSQLLEAFTGIFKETIEMSRESKGAYSINEATSKFERLDSISMPDYSQFDDVIGSGSIEKKKNGLFLLNPYIADKEGLFPDTERTTDQNIKGIDLEKFRADFWAKKFSDMKNSQTIEIMKPHQRKDHSNEQILFLKDSLKVSEDPEPKVRHVKLKGKVVKVKDLKTLDGGKLRTLPQPKYREIEEEPKESKLNEAPPEKFSPKLKKEKGLAEELKSFTSSELEKERKKSEFYLTIFIVLCVIDLFAIIIYFIVK